MYSKELLKGTLSAIILKLLAENEKMYGYEISQHVKTLTEGKIHLKDGSLYPALQKLTADGLLSYKEEYVGNRVRKYYMLTKKGKTETVAHIAELKDFMATLNKIMFPQLKPS
jgi:DNA-binding PadR family transcriptional regulator